MIYGRIYGFFRDRGILRKNKVFLDESTDFFVLGSATTPPPRLWTHGIPRAPSEPLQLRRVNFFGYYPKSQDFLEFRLGNPVFGIS